MAFLKNLEITGFKSFADKTYLEFKEGITAIVGPNGSGKSNIVEAFRFALGERESKNLRSEKSEDLIFAGNEKRPAANFAEVKITFNNGEKLLPLDYEEIEIKRKINKEGFSEFFLNKSQVRLKDIIELLSKIKLGTKGLGIINQGEADNILKAAPPERRIMLEEILGLKQYQLKKHESERQMDATKKNIEQAKILIEEILPHLRSLRRQTSRWEKRSQIEENLKNLELQHFSRRFFNIENNKSILSPQIEKIKEGLEKNENQIKKLENEISSQEKNKPAADTEFNQIENKINALIEEKNKLSRTLGRIEALIEDRKKNPAPTKIPTPLLPKLNILILISTLKTVKNDLLSIKEIDDLIIIKSKVEEIVKKIDALFMEPKIDRLPLLNEEFKIQSEIDSFLKEQDATEAEISKITAEINDLQNKIKNVKEKNDSRNAAFYELVKKVEPLRFVQRENERQLNELKLEEEKEKLKDEDLKDDLKQAGWQWEEFLEKIRQQTGVNLEEEFEGLEEKIYKLRKELQAIGEIDAAVVEEAKSTEERYQFLQTQCDDLTQAINNLEKLIGELTEKIEEKLESGIERINKEFAKFFELIFGRSSAKLYFSEPPEIIPADANASENEHKEQSQLKNKNFPAKTEENNISSGSPQDEKYSLKKQELGIEISINIYRKRIKSVEMLSGGEKALTSIALLFAIVSAAEPPFLILDEIDAALDQQNTKIFTKILRELSTKTQFILISHNNITMEAANILYGVTMGQDGVSKILSLRLSQEIQK